MGWWKGSNPKNCRIVLSRADRSKGMCIYFDSYENALGLKHYLLFSTLVLLYNAFLLIIYQLDKLGNDKAKAKQMFTQIAFNLKKRIAMRV